MAAVLATAAVAAALVVPAASAATGPAITALTGVTPGATVTGTARIEAKVTGQVDAVRFALTGPADRVWTEREAPYLFGGNSGSQVPGFSTTSVPDGRYTLTATATGGGKQSTRTVAFTVANRPPATPGVPPTVPAAPSGTPKIWVLSDLSVPGGGTDRDDIVSLAALSTYSNRFDIRKVVVGSTTVRIDCDAALRYATDSFGAHLPGVTEASTCANADGFTTCNSRHPWLDNPPATVLSLITAIRAGGLTVLNWGPMTEIAGAVCWLEHRAPADLSKVSIISHWTDASPGYPTSGRAYNCAKDQSACDYLHLAARRGSAAVKLLELGGAGQRFIDEANDRCGAGTAIPNSGLGRFLNETKDSGTPDFSDATSFLMLVTGGTNGYDLDGTDTRNFTRAFQQLCDKAPQIFDHLRSNLS